MKKLEPEIVSSRTDISKYLVHLTREYEKKPAIDNLISILISKKIIARNFHCLYNSQLKAEDIDIQKKFKVICLTETPLDKINLLTNVPKRSFNLEPYGIIFMKEDLIEYGANPVFYVYEKYPILKQYLLDQYEDYIFKLTQGKNTRFYVLGAFINVVNNKYDFHWEREWRIRETLKFKNHEVFAIIAPEKVHKLIQKEVDEDWIRYTPFIDSTWNMETIVEKLSKYMWDELYFKRQGFEND